MNKVNEITVERVIPISWNLMTSAVIGGALFVDQFLVLGQSGTLMDSECGTFGGSLVNCSDNEDCEGTYFCSCHISGKPRWVRMLKCFT